MKRTLCCGFAAGLVLLTGDLGFGQYPVSPYGRAGQFGATPPYLRSRGVSPYLNLVGTGVPGINYYLQVLPEFERRQQQAQVQTAIQTAEQRAVTQATGDIETLLRNLRVTDPLPGTGHPVRFDDLGTYFPRRGPAQPGR